MNEKRRIDVLICGSIWNDEIREAQARNATALAPIEEISLSCYHKYSCRIFWITCHNGKIKRYSDYLSYTWLILVYWSFPSAYANGRQTKDWWFDWRVLIERRSPGDTGKDCNRFGLDWGDITFASSNKYSLRRFSMTRHNGKIIRYSNYQS